MLFHMILVDDHLMNFILNETNFDILYHTLYASDATKILTVQTDERSHDT